MGLTRWAQCWVKLPITLAVTPLDAAVMRMLAKGPYAEAACLKLNCCPGHIVSTAAPTPMHLMACMVRHLHQYQQKFIPLNMLQWQASCECSGACKKPSRSYLVKYCHVNMGVNQDTSSCNWLLPSHLELPNLGHADVELVTLLLHNKWPGLQSLKLYNQLALPGPLLGLALSASSVLADLNLQVALPRFDLSGAIAA